MQHLHGVLTAPGSPLAVVAMPARHPMQCPWALTATGLHSSLLAERHTQMNGGDDNNWVGGEDDDKGGGK